MALPGWVQVSAIRHSFHSISYAATTSGRPRALSARPGPQLPQRRRPTSPRFGGERQARPRGPPPVWKRSFTPLVEAARGRGLGHGRGQGRGRGHGRGRENKGTAHDENMTPSPASAPEARCWATGPVLREGQGGARSEVKHPRPGLNDTARQGHPRPGTARHAAKKNTAPHGNGTQRDTAPHGRGGGAPNRARHSTSAAHPRHGKRGGGGGKDAKRTKGMSINQYGTHERQVQLIQ